MARIRNVEDPLLLQDVATMNYVQNYVGGLSGPIGYICSPSAPFFTTLNTTPAKITTATIAPVLVNFSGGISRLTYNGLSTANFLISYSVNFTTGSALSSTFNFNIYKNGSYLSESDQKITTLASTGSNWYCVSVSIATSLSNGDYVEIFGTSSSSISTVTLIVKLTANVS